MFKADDHQAQGLVGWDVAMPIRVIPVVREPQDLPSAWLMQGLATGLKSLGHDAVCVQQGQGWRREDWCQDATVVLQRITSQQHPGQVVVMGLPLDIMATLFDGSSIRPVVAWANDKKSTVQAYNALKVLKQASNLSPILMPLHGFDSPEANAQEDRLSWLLQCAQSVLGWQPAVWHLSMDVSAHVVRPASNLLKLLESAAWVPALPTVTSTGFGAADVQRQRHA